jgi:hypothetical protein
MIVQGAEAVTEVDHLRSMDGAVIAAALRHEARNGDLRE